MYFISKLLKEDSSFDPSAEDNHAIKKASKNGHNDLVKILLQDNRVDPSAENNCAISSASRNGHNEVVKLLLQDQRVDPSDLMGIIMLQSTM